MDFKQIESFLMVVEKGSFSAAAQSLYITQPSISQRIQLLEDELKTPLFERTKGKKIMLTPAGEDIFKYYKEAFQLIIKGNNVLHQNLSSMRRIVIACPNHLPDHIIPGIMGALYEKFPHIHFQIKISVTAKMVEGLRNGIIDICIAYLNVEYQQPNFSIVNISKEKTILVAGRDHSFSKINPIPLHNLSGERIFIYTKTFLSTVMIDQLLRNSNVTQHKMVEVKNLNWIKKMVEMGLGVSFLQKSIVKTELEENSLVELGLENIALPETIVSLMLRHEVPTDIKDTIIETTKKLYKKN